MLPRIVITSSMGSISVSTKRAQLSYTPDKVELNISNPVGPTVDMRTEQASLQIDQTDAFASAGLKKPLPMALDYFGKSLQTGIQAIGTIAEEGEEFLRIESGANAVDTIATRNLFGRQPPTLTVRAMPDAAPEITAKPGSVSLNFNGNKLKTNWDINPGQYEYSSYEITITWAVRPSIEVSVEPGMELVFPVRGIGENVNTAT